MRWETDLVQDIRLGDHRDDLDWPYEWIGHSTTGKHYFTGILPEFQLWNTDGTGRDFSDANSNALREKLLERKDQIKCIIEIGVCREALDQLDSTSTGIFFQNKHKHTQYIGIDKRELRSLNHRSKNIEVVRADSSDISRIKKRLVAKEIESVDFLMIDGWHSINQVLLDWEYTQWLSDDGIVAFHDTAYHPGPNLFLKYLNRDTWNVEENVCSHIKNDFGLGFAWRKK